MASDPEPADALEAALSIAAQLEAAGVEYAIGGALALGCWVQHPRATIDADINLFLDPDDIDGCLDQLLEHFALFCSHPAVAFIAF